MAMTLVGTVEIGSGGAASIGFTNIPQTGKDLLLVLSLRITESTAARNTRVSINGTEASTGRVLRGSSTVAASLSQAAPAGYAPGANATANTFSNDLLYFCNYAGSASKIYSLNAVSENNASTNLSAIQMIAAGNVGSTSAISSLSVKDSGSTNLVQYSTASLYIIS